MADYEPGKCNIGRAERRKRRFVGRLGFALAALVVAAILFVRRLPDGWVLVAVVPLFVGFLGYLQARRSFCVGFAIGGRYDVSEEGADRHRITDEEARQADLRRAVKLQAIALGAAFVVALAVYALLRIA